MVNKVPTEIPVVFETVDQIDTRFQKVKIWLMHLGQNYNNSIFTKEVVEAAMESLKNTPILGYIEESRLGEKDFRGHEVELVVEDGELKTKYIGQALGVIPENCNPRFEVKKGDFDNDLEYLVVDGLMWTKFEDGVNILNAHSEVSQSMELHDEYDGHFNEDGVFTFTRFSFYGACLLGKDVLPAMQKATVEVSFSTNVNVYQDEIARKLEEYQIAFSKKQEVEQAMTLEQLLSKYSTTVESLAEKGVEVTSYSIEELEAKLEEVFAEGQIEDEGKLPATQMEGEDSANGEDESEDEGEPESKDEGTSEKFTVSFELSHDDIRSQMWNKIDSHMSASGVEESWFYISKVYDSHVIVESDSGERFYKVGYARDNDVVSFSDVVEVHPMFLTTDEKGALELMRSNFDQYERENVELKEFKLNILKEQHEVLANEIFAKFSKLTEDEVANIRENVHTFSLEEIESKLFEMLGRKTANFTATKSTKSHSMKITVNANSESPNPSGYAHLFKKHGL